jgi:non-heme chloroperoxidase
LTRHHSERVSRIVLVAATAPFPMQTDDNPGGIPKSMADAVAAARAADRPRWMAEMTASFFALDLPRNKVSPELIHWMQDMAVQCSPRASSACFEAGFTTDLRAEMRAITVPTLIIHGDHDAQAQVDICGRKSARLVPDSTFIEYAGAGHGLFITHADRLNADLLKFINS